MNVKNIRDSRKGKYVPIKETVRLFREIIEGKHDSKPEGAFYMIGGANEIG